MGRPKKNVEGLVGETANAPLEPASVNLPLKQDNLTMLITRLATAIEKTSVQVAKLTEEMELLKNPKVQMSEPVQTITPSTPPTPIIIQTTPSFLTAIPSELLSVAQEVLGEKFTFECVPAKDKPFFDFVVIVPPEYSKLPVGIQDRRSRLVPNSAGPEGVRDWCLKVKENVIKVLGKQLPVNA